MSDLIARVKEIYAAFDRGDIDEILASMTEDVSWEFEAPAEITWGGVRKGREEAAGFFVGIAAEHGNPLLQMTAFFADGNKVAAFGRYDATVLASGIRVSTPVGHYFEFRDGKISRYINLVNTGVFVEAARTAAAAA